MLRYGLAIVIGLVLLPGCSTPAERAARGQAEVDDMIRVYGPGCEKLGYAKDSEPWRECILQLSARHDYSTHPTTTSCVGQQGFFNCITY